MKALANTTVLEFHPDTLQNVRREFKLEEPKRLEEAIDLMQEWARKQEHFTVKEFDRDFLEKLIIQSKGLLERAKIRLDKQCTLRSLLSDFYRPINVKEELRHLDFMLDASLPKLTPKNYRVYILKNIGKQFTSKLFMDYYVRLVCLWQYLQRHDYNAGYIIVYDLTYANMKEIITNVNFSEFRDFATVITEGYGSRIREVYLISNSKLVQSLVDLSKPFLSRKISDRVVHMNDAELLKTKLPEEILPSEYGGKEKSLVQLHLEWQNVLSSDDHIQYMKKMNELGTNESKRQLDKFNEEYLGMPGTFRTMSVD